MFILTGKKTKDARLKKFKMSEQNLFGFFLSHKESCRIDKKNKRNTTRMTSKILFLFFSKTPTHVKLGTSEPIGSVEFRRFTCNRIPIQISSDKFRSVPMGSVDFQQISCRNFAEPTGTFQAETVPESCCKEIVGTQRRRPKKKRDL